MLPASTVISTRRRGLYLYLLIALTCTSLVREYYIDFSQFFPCSSASINEDSEEDANHKHKPHFTPRSELPQIAWLMSYPNSGTSYTMMLAENLSNFSTASNYGVEVAKKFGVSPLVHKKHPEGPFWEGLALSKGKTIRELPPHYVLTKTHCGGRCVACSAKSYVVSTEEFLDECTRTSARVEGHKRRVASKMSPHRVARMVHLIRNPFHNVISRYHLSRRHALQKNPKMGKFLTDNAAGFKAWCKLLDSSYGTEEKEVFDSDTRHLMKRVPCHAEFFKYTQWHNKVHEIRTMVGDGSPPIMTIYYEDYEDSFNATASSLLAFLEQPVVQTNYKFREMPDYSGYFSGSQERAAQSLIAHIASNTTQSLLSRYLSA